MSDTAARNSYNRLATDTFGLSFENWYNSGFFDNSHIPYTMFDGEKAVANVSVNKMDILSEGKTRKCIQLGTVMTRPEYRNQGLARILMEQVIADFADSTDCVFLYGNSSVTEFYPRFGFEKLPQYYYTKPVLFTEDNCRKLYMTDHDDIQILKQHYEKTNPFSAMQQVGGFGLLMFYCSSFFADFVWYHKESDAVIIAEQDGDTLICYDIFCDAGRDFNSIISAVSAPGTTRIKLAFTPSDTQGFDMAQDNNPDTTLFVKGADIFAGGRLRLTDTSHT